LDHDFAFWGLDTQLILTSQSCDLRCRSIGIKAKMRTGIAGKSSIDVADYNIKYINHIAKGKNELANK